MEKTVTINIGGSVFHIEDEAYDLLKSYLIRIGDFYNGSSTDGNEIVSDIEDRIAELLHEQLSKGQIANMLNVEKIIETVGEPEEFDDDSGERFKSESSFQDAKEKEPQKSRRIYRDPYQSKIAGVCGGIAVYCNTDPLTVRLLFALLVLFGGMSLWVYAILWFIIPKAKSFEQVKQMKSNKGGPAHFINNLRNSFETLRKNVADLESGSSKDKTKGREKVIRSGSKFLLWTSAPILFLFLLLQFIFKSILIPYIINHDVFTWSFIGYDSHPLIVTTNGFVGFLAIIAFSSLVLTFIFAENRKKLTRDPANRVVGGVCGGLGRSISMDPVLMRLLFLSFLLIFPYFVVVYLIVWIVLPDAVFLTSDGSPYNNRYSADAMNNASQENTMGAENASPTDDGSNSDSSSTSQDQQYQYYPQKKSSAGKIILLVLGILVTVTILNPLIIALIGVIGSVILIPEFLDFGQSLDFLPFPFPTDQLLSESTFFWGRLGIIGLILIPVIIISLMLVSLFRSKKVPYIGFVIFLLIIGWFATVGGMVHMVKDEVVNYKEVATVSHEQILPAMNDTIVLTLKDWNPKASIKNRKGWSKLSRVHINPDIDIDEWPTATSLDIERAYDNDLKLFLSNSGRGETASMAEASANQINYDYKIDGDKVIFSRFFELKEGAQFRAQSLDLTLKVPVGKTLYLDPSTKKFLYDIENTDNMWDDEMVGKYWLMTEEGLQLSE